MPRLAVLAAATVALLLVVDGISDAALAGAAWSVMATPNVLTPNGTLDAVSCPSVTVCVAVGQETNSGGDADVPLAESWNGKSWRVLPHPRIGVFDAVSCVSAKACMAVGQPYGGGFAAWWNGKSWTTKSTVVRGLDGVSCTSSTACIAVGGAGDAISGEVGQAESWNGKRWTVIPISVPKNAITNSWSLDGVSCGSPKACMAVGQYLSGDYTDTLAELWNGKSWTVTPTREGNPYPGAAIDALVSVSCPSSTTCVAVGNALMTEPGTPNRFAESWNGKGWRRILAPSVDALSCTSSTACTSVGAYHDPESGFTLPLAESWNGKIWTKSLPPYPSRGTRYALDAVSCRTSARCMAVGSYTNDLTVPVTMAESLKGLTWSFSKVLNPSGAVDNSLSAVSCASDVACVAVGHYAYGTGPSWALAESWNGKSWTIRPTSKPKDATQSALNALSCRSSATCIAVGQYTKGTRAQRTLAESWNGRSWTIIPTPNPTDASGIALTAVSCTSPTACMAIGRYDVNNAPDLLAEAWNGKSWTIDSTPYGGSLDAVSCTSSKACTAVGQAGSQTLAESWNGKSWTIRTTPNPKDGMENALNAVSCTSLTTCIAVGEFSDGEFSDMTLVELWNGKKWVIVLTPLDSVPLEAVSCTSSTTCLAVGGSAAQSWNGKIWTSTPMPDVGSFNAVSCVPSTACVAVGQSYSDVTLAERGRV